MNLLTIFAVAVALGADAFSLALGMGLTGIKRKEVFLFPAIVAVFHVFMPLAGLYAGRFLGELLGQVAGLLGGAILIVIGGRTLYKSIKGSKQEAFSFRNARVNLRARQPVVARSLNGMLLLAVGVSLDALSVGFGLGTLGAAIFGAVLVMGFVAGSMTLLGLVFGKYLGGWIGQRAEVAGGLILLFIGLRIMV